MEKGTHKRSYGKHLVIASVLVAIVAVVSAIGLLNIDKFPMASTQAIVSDNLFNLELVIIGFLFALVMVFMLYSLYVFRRKKGEEGDHHLFEVSRRYSNEAGTESSKYVLVYFVESSEKMLTVLPAHRLVINAGGLAGDEIVRRLAKYFRVEKAAGVDAVMKKLEKLRDRHAFGMYLGKGHFFVLALKDIKAVDEAIKDKPKDWKRLDVSILHLSIFQHVLGIADDDGNIEFVKSPQETAASVDKGGFACAFFLNPTKVAEVKRIARLGEKMPRKATYFYPKPISGVVIKKH